MGGKWPLPIFSVSERKTDYEDSKHLVEPTQPSSCVHEQGFKDEHQRNTSQACTGCCNRDTQFTIVKRTVPGLA